MHRIKKLLVIGLILLQSQIVQSAFTEFYTQSGGSNLNAGSTTDNAAVFTFTAGNWVQSTGVFTASGADLSGLSAGMFASVYADGTTDATGFVGRITAVDDGADTITVSLTAIAGTAPTDGTGNRTIKVGGAWLGPSGAVDHPFDFAVNTLTNASGDDPRVNFKNTATYSITAAIQSNKAGRVVFQGYTTTPGDGGRATIDGGTSNISLMTVTGTNNVYADLILQNNGVNGVNGFNIIGGGNNIFYRDVVNNVRTNGFNVSGGRSIIVECEVYAAGLGNTAGVAGFTVNNELAVLIRNFSHDNTGSNIPGFLFTSGATTTAIENIADTNGSYGFFLNQNGRFASLIGNDAYNNTGDGIRITIVSNGAAYLENNNLIKNGGYGINRTDTTESAVLLQNNAFGAGTQANTSGATNGFGSVIEVGSVTYANDVTPWVDPANGDFRINLHSAKNNGRGNFTQTQSGYSGTIGYPDIGAAFHLDSGVIGAFGVSQ